MQNFTASELIDIGDLIGTIKATGADYGDTLTFQLTSREADSATFKVNTDGELKLYSTLDYEAKDTYVFQATVISDLSGLNSTIEVTVHVEDGNDLDVTSIALLSGSSEMTTTGNETVPQGGNN